MRSLFLVFFLSCLCWAVKWSFMNCLIFYNLKSFQKAQNLENKYMVRKRFSYGWEQGPGGNLSNFLTVKKSQNQFGQVGTPPARNLGYFFKKVRINLVKAPFSPNLSNAPRKGPPSFSLKCDKMNKNLSFDIWSIRKILLSNCWWFERIQLAKCLCQQRQKVSLKITL